MYKDKLKYSLLNGFIGDQYGLPYEMLPHFTIMNEYISFISYDKYDITTKNIEKPNTYSDDTQMTLAVIELLDVHKLEFNNDMVLDYYVKFFEPSRGYCMQIYNLLLDKVEGKKIKELNITDNGGIMRISPLVKYANNLTLSEINHYVSILHYPTHNNQESNEVSTMYIYLLDEFLNMLVPSLLSVLMIINKMFNLINGKNLKKNVQLIIENIDNNDEYLIADQLIGLDGVECYESFTCAIWAICKNFDTPKLIMYKALLYGGDTDSVCSIVGHLVGAIFGKEAIVDNLLNNLENKDIIIKLVDKYVYS